MGDLEFRLIIRVIDLILMLMEKQKGRIDDASEIYVESALARIGNLIDRPE